MRGQMVAFCGGPHIPCSSEEGPQAECAGGLCRGTVAVCSCIALHWGVTRPSHLHVLLASPDLCSELPGEGKSLTHCEPSC